MRNLASQLGRRSKLLGTLGKILLGHFQVLRVFSSSQSVVWPAAFAKSLDYFSFLSFQIFSVSPLGCALGVNVTFTHELVGMLLLPLCGALLVLLLALLAAQCTLPKGERGLCSVATRPETCTLLLWLMLLLYPSVGQASSKPFDCMDVPFSGQRVLRADPSVACDGDEWRALAALGAIGTTIYSLGFPLVCLLVTYAGHVAQKAAIVVSLVSAYVSMFVAEIFAEKLQDQYEYEDQLSLVRFAWLMHRKTLVGAQRFEDLVHTKFGELVDAGFLMPRGASSASQRSMRRSMTEWIRGVADIASSFAAPPPSAHANRGPRARGAKEIPPR